MKSPDFVMFLTVSAHDPRSGDVLLRHRRHRAEVHLHRLEPVVNRLAEHRGHDREYDHRQQRQRGESRADLEHECEGKHAAENGVDEVHDRRAGRHPHRAQVVRQPGHDFAGPVLCKPGRVERLNVLEQIVPEIELDLPAHAIHELTHAVPEAATDDCRRNHHGDDSPHRADGCAGLHAVERLSEQPGDHARESRRRHDQEQAGSEGYPIRRKVRYELSKRLHPWHRLCVLP
jgi:hypothetical protein